MNKKGHPQTLVAAHPGNVNAVKNGTHSPRLIQSRAEQIIEEFGISDSLDEAGRVVLDELARLVAVIEAIDRDLDERGVSDRNGKERYLLQRRERYSQRLMDVQDRLLLAQRRSLPKPSTDHVKGEQWDYIRQLQAIALGLEPDAEISDRLAALKLLTALGREGSTSHYEPQETRVPFPDDSKFQAEVTQLERDFEAARKKGYLEKLRQQISVAELFG